MSEMQEWLQHMMHVTPKAEVT